MGGFGAGLIGSSILDGIGQGLIERKQRQDRLKDMGLQATLKLYSTIAANPNLRPEAMPDVLGAGFGAVRAFTGQDGKKQKGKGAKGKGQPDPLAAIQQQFEGLAHKSYEDKSRPGFSAAAPSSLAGTPAEGMQAKQPDTQVGGMRKEGIFESRAEQVADEDRYTRAKDDRELENKRRTLEVEQPFKLEQEAARQHVVSAKPTSSNEKIQVTGPDGQEFTAFRDPTSRKIFNLAGAELPGDQYKVAEKSNAGEMGAEEKSRVWANKNLNNPDPNVARAAKDTLKHLDSVAQGVTIRNVIATKNAADNIASADKPTIDYWANYIATKGEIPYALMRNLGKKAVADIMAQVPKIAAEKGMSVGDVIAQQADVKSMSAALTKMETQYAQTKAFEQTAQANLDRAIKAAGKIVDSGSPLINKPWRKAEESLLGKPEYTAYHAARVVAFTEVAKVLNNPNGSGAVSDSARKEAEGALGENATLEQLQAAAQILRDDMGSRMAAMEQTIGETRKRIAGGGTGPTPTKQAPIVQHSASTGQYRYSVDGGKTWQPGQPPSQ